MRQQIVGLLRGDRPPQPPCFSGLISVTAAGIAGLGLRFGDLHADPARMAAAAATSWTFGLESAVVPLDMCVEAGALGAAVDFRTNSARPEFPMIVRPLAAQPDDLDLKVPPDILRRDRVPMVLEAIRLLREQVGGQVVVGAWVPGPFTLALQLVDMSALVTAVARAPQSVARLLDPLADVLAEVACAYRAAGADFITVHEMGGSPGFIGPPAFRKLVLPRLKRLLDAIPALRVLSVCGNTNRAMPLLAEAGADALSVDQTNDLARSRQTLGSQALLFGNIDPIGTLTNGSVAEVEQAVRQALKAGVDAVWPGCDLWPAIPAANIQAMARAARNFGGIDETPANGGQQQIGLG